MSGFYIRTDSPQTHLICFDVERYRDKIKNFSSSYGVIEARVLNFTYPEYLCFCRQNGATLRGREGYSSAYFKNKLDAEKICNLLNENWKIIKENLEGER